jgi:hypothetical protein
VITPEYNHGYPASLKQAIDMPYREWNAKPVAFVSYGGMSGRTSHDRPPAILPLGTSGSPSRARAAALWASGHGATTSTAASWAIHPTSALDT